MSVNPDGTIHDDALGINWLPDANLAMSRDLGGRGLTFGIDQGLHTDPTAFEINPDGSMGHDTAVAWIAAMNRFDNGRGYLGHTNWRLPDSPDLDDQGYYKTGTEMGQLFYSELGGRAGGSVQLADGVYNGMFHNFQPYYYWSGSQTNGKVGTDSDSHESFSFGTGYRSDNTFTNFMYIIPVYDSPRVVTTDRDAGEGSLRQVVKAAHGGDTIEFSSRARGQDDQAAVADHTRPRRRGRAGGPQHRGARGRRAGRQRAGHDRPLRPRPLRAAGPERSQRRRGSGRHHDRRANAEERPREPGPRGPRPGGRPSTSRRTRSSTTGPSAGPMGWPPVGPWR